MIKLDIAWGAMLRLITVIFASHMALAYAAPEDDFRAGSRAFHSGDIVQAMALLKKAADAGNAPSQALLGDILDQAEFDEEALTYYRKAAQQGNADGEFGVGKMHAAGEGVKRDAAEALKWITRAAEKDHALAIKVLAQAYTKGELGLSEAQRSSPDALRWVRRAADGGDIASLQFLARAHRVGDLGLAADPRQAEAFEAKIRALQGVADNTRTKKKGRN